MSLCPKRIGWCWRLACSFLECSSRLELPIATGCTCFKCWSLSAFQQRSQCVFLNGWGCRILRSSHWKCWRQRCLGRNCWWCSSLKWRAAKSFCLFFISLLVLPIILLATLGCRIQSKHLIWWLVWSLFQPKVWCWLDRLVSIQGSRLNNRTSHTKSSFHFRVFTLWISHVTRCRLGWLRSFPWRDGCRTRWHYWYTFWKWAHIDSRRRHLREGLGQIVSKAI